MLSTTRSRRRSPFGYSPLSPRKPACRPTPTSVPMVSKKSAMAIEKTATSVPTTPMRANDPKLSPAPKVEKSGSATTALGITATPGRLAYTAPPIVELTTMAITVVTRMPSSMPPGIRQISKSRISTRPASRMKNVGEARLPSASGAPGEPITTTPPFTRPISRIKRPMPTAIAPFSRCGIAFITFSRSPVSTSTRIRMPSIRITPIASCQVRPEPATSPNATTAFSPIPGAIING